MASISGSGSPLSIPTRTEGTNVETVKLDTNVQEISKVISKGKEEARPSPEPKIAKQILPNKSVGLDMQEFGILGYLPKDLIGQVFNYLPSSSAWGTSSTYSSTMDFRNTFLISGKGSALNFQCMGTLIEEINKISKLTPFFAITDGTLVLPRLIGPMTTQTRQVYFDLGKILGLCYKNTRLASVHCFSRTLFDVAKILTTDQLHSSFNCLPKAVCGKMAQEVIKGLVTIDSRSNAILIRDLDLLDPVKFQLALDKEEQVFYSALASTGLDYFTEDMGVDFDKIRENPGQFVDEFCESIMSVSDLDPELCGASLNSIIEPIFYIAQGLNENCDWNQLQNDQDLISRIQAPIDRDTIANAITNSTKQMYALPDQKINCKMIKI